MVVNASEADLYCQQSYSLSTLPVFRNYFEFQNFVRLPKYAIIYHKLFWWLKRIFIQCIVSSRRFKSAKKYWIGARRICNSVAKNTSSFLWLDASLVELQWWNNTGPSVVEENCVVIYSNATNKYTWLDFSCTENVYPVCQFRIQSRKQLCWKKYTKVKINVFNIYSNFSCGTLRIWLLCEQYCQ